MNKIKKRGFLLLIIMIVIVFFLNGMLQPVYAANEKNGSSIAGIKINTTDKKEIEQKLLQAILLWKETPLIVKTKAGEIELETSQFQFRTKETVEEFQALTNKPWYQFWKKNNNVEAPVHFTIQDGVMESLKNDPSIMIDETIEKMNEQIGYFLTSEIQAIQTENSSFQEERLALVMQDVMGNRSSIELLIEHLDGTTFNPNERFSYLNTLETLTDVVDQESIDYIASILYSLILQSNYGIIERHANPVVIKSFSPGKEAHVNRLVNKDLVFENPNVVSGTLKMSIDNNNVKAELYSIPLDERIEVYEAEKQEVQPRIIYRYTDKLAVGEEEVIEGGQPGIKVSIYRKVSEKYGSFETDTLISRDFYPPVHQVILRSSLQLEIVPENVPDGVENTVNNGGNEVDDEPNQGSTSPSDPQSGKGNNNSTRLPGNDSSSDTNGSVDGHDVNVQYDKGGNIIEPAGK